MRADESSRATRRAGGTVGDFRGSPGAVDLAGDFADRGNESVAKERRDEREVFERPQRIRWASRPLLDAGND